MSTDVPLIGFALTASFSPTGDALLPPQASFVAVPTLVTPHQPLTLVFTTLNVAYVRITGNNLVDYQHPPTPGSLTGFDTGFISTSGTGLYPISAGFTATILLTLTAYDSSFVSLGLTPTQTIMVT
jgi:hypothetical protein